MTGDQERAERIKRFLKAELKRADVTREELARRMTASGLEETKASAASELSRGGFGATFFLAALKAAGVEQVRVLDA